MTSESDALQPLGKTYLAPTGLPPSISAIQPVCLDDQDLPTLLNPKSSLPSRGHSFASTTVGSPLSVTTDSADAASPQTLSPSEDVSDLSTRRGGFAFMKDVVSKSLPVHHLASSDSVLGLGLSSSPPSRFRTPQALPVEAPLSSSGGTPTASRFRTPLASSSDAVSLTEIAPARFGTPNFTSAAFPPLPSQSAQPLASEHTPSLDQVSDPQDRYRSSLSSKGLYKSTSVVSETRSTGASPLGWPRLRFASCSEEVKERKPFSAADLISKYESAQSGTYKEYRKWKESKWGEDALDEVEFEDDDVNLELSIPAVFSLPIIQLPSIGEALQNVHERLVGYMITVTDLIINADYYLRHPRDLWQSVTSAVWMLLPSPPKHIVDSFINVVCEPTPGLSSDDATDMQTMTHQFIEQSGFGIDPLMEDQDGDVSTIPPSSGFPSAAPDPSGSFQTSPTIVVSAGQYAKWSLQILLLIVSVCVALTVMLAARLYDLGLWCSRFFAVFDTADLLSCQYIPWTSSAASTARDDAKHSDAVEGFAEGSVPERERVKDL